MGKLMAIACLSETTIYVARFHVLGYIAYLYSRSV